jgi:FK506-binding protein 4/5
VKLIGKLEDGTLFVKKGHDGEEPFEFKTDEDQVIEGLDKAVLSMKKGEVSLVTIPPHHAFGTNETTKDLATVPPNSYVYYEMELVSFDKVNMQRQSLYGVLIGDEIMVFIAVRRSKALEHRLDA